MWEYRVPIQPCDRRINDRTNAYFHRISVEWVGFSTNRPQGGMDVTSPSPNTHCRGHSYLTLAVFLTAVSAVRGPLPACRLDLELSPGNGASLRAAANAPAESALGCARTATARVGKPTAGRRAGPCSGIQIEPATRLGYHFAQAQQGAGAL